MSGWTDKLKGKFNEVKGKTTGDRTEELKGKAQQAMGSLKEKADELRNQSDQGHEIDPQEGDRPQ